MDSSRGFQNFHGRKGMREPSTGTLPRQWSSTCLLANHLFCTDALLQESRLRVTYYFPSQWGSDRFPRRDLRGGNPDSHREAVRPIYERTYYYVFPTTQLGFLSDMDFANKLLAGDVHIPWDVDDVTATVLGEVIRLFGLLRDGHSKIDLTADQFRYYWRGFKERTSSSISGIHAGHYKLATHS